MSTVDVISCMISAAHVSLTAKNLTTVTNQNPGYIICFIKIAMERWCLDSQCTRSPARERLLSITELFYFNLRSAEFNGNLGVDEPPDKMCIARCSFYRLQISVRPFYTEYCIPSHEVVKQNHCLSDCHFC
jgi:hypothetical protein